MYYFTKLGRVSAGRRPTSPQIRRQLVVIFFIIYYLLMIHLFRSLLILAVGISEDIVLLGLHKKDKF